MEVTQLLRKWYDGDRNAMNDIMSLVYDDLRKLARNRLNDWQSVPFEPTVLVHEIYLKLRETSEFKINDKTHFLHLAGSIMQRILVDQARHRNRKKRGEGKVMVTLDEEVLAGIASVDLFDLQQCIEELAACDWRQARIVEWKVFAGLSTLEIAQTLGVSERTVKRDWRMAKAWLSRQLRP